MMTPMCCHIQLYAATQNQRKGPSWLRDEWFVMIMVKVNGRDKFRIKNKWFTYPIENIKRFQNVRYINCFHGCNNYLVDLLHKNSDSLSADFPLKSHRGIPGRCKWINGITVFNRLAVYAWPQPIRIRLASTPVVDVNKIPVLCMYVFSVPLTLRWTCCVSGVATDDATEYSSDRMQFHRHLCFWHSITWWHRSNWLIINMASK